MILWETNQESPIVMSAPISVIARLTGYEGRVVWDTSKPDGQPRRKLDTTKAKKLFDFEAEIDLEEGLRKTIDWWESHSA